MARYSAGARTAAGSTTLPIISIYSSATVNPRVREIGVFNTTNTAFSVTIVRLSTAGTRGTTLTPGAFDATGIAASTTAYNTHTVAPTIAANLGYVATLGAAAGAGILWTFGNDVGLTCAVGVTNGIGVIVSTGTGQIADAYIVWDE
jgi:hypothetical protein